MYTRHFYKKDEVTSALMYCTAFGRIREAVFWAQELLDTNLGLDCLLTLFHSWILFRGIGSLQWLETAIDTWTSGEVEDEKILLLTYQLACLPSSSRDSTALTLAYLALENRQGKPLDRLLVNGFTEMESTRDEWEQAILRAAYQKKTEVLWLLLRKYWWSDVEKIWQLLQEACVEQQKSLLQLQELERLSDDPTKHYFLLALAVGIVCMSKEDRKKSLQPLRTELDNDCKKSIEEWNTNIGRKSRREYAIPRDCLYWVTERGGLPYTTSTVNELPDLFLYLETSEYWNEAMEGLSFDDMEDLEKLAFLETYFPDGHPMTWSKEEIAKSHGEGCLSLKETPSIQKWQRIWIRGTESRVLWKGWSRASKLNISTEIGFEELYQAKREVWEEEYKSWNLKPCIKRLIPA